MMTLRTTPAIALCILAIGMFGPAFAVEPADPSAVRTWLTSADATLRLDRRPDLPFSENARAAPAIRIDAAQRHQEIVGFGASLTDASAWLIHNRMSPSQRQALLAELFGADGLGLSLTRLTIGASDFSRTHYSFDDMPKGKRDPALRHFSIAPNRAALLPTLKLMLAHNPGLKVMASPWSAPGWMKTSDSLIGGALAPRAYPAFARYLERYVEAYAAEGVPIYALTIQNEPAFVPADYPGMRVTAKGRSYFVKNHLGPLLAEKHPGVRILDWDHNWDKPFSPLRVLSDPAAARYVAGVAWHCYGGEVAAQSVVRAAHPDKETWITECSGGEWAPEWDKTLSWMARTLIIGGTRHWAKGVLLWNLALDEKHGPHLGGCENCRGVVTIDSATGEITRNVEYYVLGHASRFVRAGAYRIDSRGDVADLDHVAFVNRDGSRVLIAFNQGKEPRRFAVGDGTREFVAELPAGALASYVWR